MSNQRENSKAVIYLLMSLDSTNNYLLFQDKGKDDNDKLLLITAQSGCFCYYDYL